LQPHKQQATMARSEQETRGQDIKGREMENDKNNSHEVVEVVNIFHQQFGANVGFPKAMKHTHTHTHTKSNIYSNHHKAIVSHHHFVITKSWEGQ